LNMPETSALVLLPPTPIASTPSSSYASSTDSSFQDSLTTAQQRQSTSAPDQTQTAAAAQPPKKSNKKAKPKASATVNKSKVESDSSDPSETAEEPVAQTDPAESDSAPVAEEAADPKEQPASTPAAKDSAVALSVNIAPAANQNPAAVKAGVPLKGSQSKQAVVKSLSPNQAKDDTDQASENDSSTTDTTQSTAAAVVSASDQATKTTAAKPAGFGTATVNSENTTQDGQTQTTAKAQAVTADNVSTDAAQTAAAFSQALPADSESDALPHASTPQDGAGISSTFEQQLQKVLSPLAPKAEAPAPAPPAPETQFVDSNHPSIVTGVHSQLLPNGGTMQIRLDPPDLGALQVTVQMRDGIMSAAFETSNEQATRMLSHSLSQLKTALETSGVTVEKMHVQQAPRQQSSGNSNGDSQQQSQDPEQQQQARQEQQRRQMLQRMWNKLAGVGDPLDLVA
jgi:flagellar hook-length control protein FliK